MSYIDDTGNFYPVFGIHFLTLFLKLEREFSPLIFCGTNFHIFSSRFVMDSVVP